MKHTNSRLFH